ncbi:MAG: Tol-Pal system beta propeller repeat protein TolB [Gammaproteobacteria bacterium]
MKLMKCVVSIMLLFACTSVFSEQGLEIIIDKGIDNTLPIASIPFGWSQQKLVPVDIALVVSNDLARSGRFAPMKERHLPQRPTQFQQINFKDWRLLGMENLVIGNLRQLDADNFEVEFRLIDVYRGEQIAGFRIPTSTKQLRRTAHRISDIIYEKLTGIRGAFDTRIAYITVKKLKDGGKQYLLQIADADGFNPQVLLESPQPLLSPAWSPDGGRIAYVSFESGSSVIYVQNILTGKRFKVASYTGINSAPAWSPDGTRLAMTLSKDGDPEIYIMHLSSRTLQRITYNRAIDTEPTWSGNGDKIAFTSDRGGTPQIYEISALGGRAQRLTFDGPYNTRPGYSPDGKYLTLVHGEKGAYRIALLDRNSGYMNVLTESRLDESPSFAPNSSMIIYAMTGSRGPELAAVSADGRVHQRLALQGGEVREPTWGPFPGP